VPSSLYELAQLIKNLGVLDVLLTSEPPAQSSDDGGRGSCLCLGGGRLMVLVVRSTPAMLAAHWPRSEKQGSTAMTPRGLAEVIVSVTSLCAG
jgi:hypothetical protein